MELLKKNEKIGFQELFYLKELLAAGLPLKTCLDLIAGSSRNGPLIKVEEDLERGRSIEEAIVPFVAKGVASYLLPLLKVLPFSKALDLSLNFYARNKENYERVVKDLFYPLILLFVSLLVLFVFDRFGLDTIIALLGNFGSDGGGVRVFRVLFRVLCSLCLLIFILICIGVLYFADKRHVEMFYVLLSKYWPNSPFHLFFCEEFISLLVICLDNGYKTKEALAILRSLKARSLVSFLAFHLDKQLLDGKTLEEASEQEYFDVTLIRFIRIASYANDFCAVISNYTELTHKKIKELLKRVTLGLQLFSYALVGMVVIFIYQVLFLPMQAIAGM